MKAGASKIDITPPVGVWLEGIPRNKPSDRVLDPLYARTVYLTNDKTELVIMVCDLVGLSEDDLEPIKKQISRETGISPHNTVIAFTHTHSGPATLGILTPKEMEYIASAAAEKLNRYSHKARVKVIIPLKGFSSLSVEGGPLYDPASDEAFTVTLKKCIDPEIEIIEVDSDINSRLFAGTVAEALSQALKVK